MDQLDGLAMRTAYSYYTVLLLLLLADDMWNWQSNVLNSLDCSFVGID